MSQFAIVVGVVFIVGFIIGYVCSRIRTPDGVLRVDTSDPEKDRYLMEFHIPLDDIPERKIVRLIVDSKKMQVVK